MPSNVSLSSLLVVVATWHGQICSGQAQQYVLDTMTDGTVFEFLPGITSTTDGGTILDLGTAQGDLQWKMDQAGEPVWCKQYGISGHRRTRMPDGGLMFCEVTGYIPDGDTSHIQLRIVRSDAQGEVIWSKLVTIHDPYVTLFNNLWLYIASADEGNCLITMSEVQSSAYQWFYCLDASGEVLWSRHFLFNPNAEHVEQICSDGLGGWFFGSYDWGRSVFRLGRLNSFGDMAWYKSYAVLFPQEFWLGGICSLCFQAIAVGGYEAVFNEDYRWFVMRLNLKGTLDWFRVSSTPEAGLANCSATSSGELLVSDGIGGIAYNLSRLTGTGEVVSSFRSAMHTVAETTYSSWFIDWDHFDTTLTMGNMLVTYSDTSDFPSYQPGVWRLPISDLSACDTEANEVASVLASNSNVAVQDQPYSEVVVPYTITDTVCTVTSFPPISVSDYCYYFTGVEPVYQPSSSATVASTLLASGTPLSVTASGASCIIMVHDAQGRMLYRGLLAPNSNERILTSAWASGLYFVRFQGEDGGRPNVVKVVIE